MKGIINEKPVLLIQSENSGNDGNRGVTINNPAGLDTIKVFPNSDSDTGYRWEQSVAVYGLDRLAAKPDAEVIVCEGEKASDAASRLFPEKVIVSNVNGAKSPWKSDWSSLAGRTVFLWGDFDVPGVSYIAAVERLVTDAGAFVTHTIRPEWFLQMGRKLGIERKTLPEGWNAADAEQEKFTADNIQAFIEQEKTLHGENSLFILTQNQQKSVVEELVQSDEHPHHQKVVAAKKRAQTRELFNDSEFAVILSRKGFKNGVYWQEPFGEDDVPKRPTLLCSPLIVVAQTRDIYQSNWGKLLTWQDNDGHEHHWACPDELLAGSDAGEFRRELVRNGLTISTFGRARQMLVEYVLNYKPLSDNRVRCVNKIGWYDKRYVLGHQVYGKQDGESVIYQGVTNGDYTSVGTLTDWQREVAARAVGNSRIVFAICTAFAGILTEMACESGGGFQFTGDTSKGKTSTLIDPAASVWGHPDNFAKKWRATTNGLEALCLSRNHSTLMLDDLGQSNAKECGQAAYMIANGQSKVRMQKEGVNRPLSTWKVMILSSGELDIAQHMAEAGKVAKGGQVIRLPSIPADAGAGMFAIERLHDQPDGRQFTDTLKAMTRKYYGTAGVAFLEKLTSPETLKETTDSIRGGITEIVKLLKIPDGAAPEIGRVAARFALVAHAGELATKFGVTGWEKGEALKASNRCFNDWLFEAGCAVSADNKVLFAQVSAFLQAHGASRFPPHDISSADLQNFQNRAGFSHNHEGNVYFWVESGAFNRELCKGFNPTTAAKSLVKAGWLEPGPDRLQQKKRVNAVSVKKGLWFYVLTFKALCGEL